MINGLVSVIITTYKRNVDLLMQAVESVRQQSYNPIEIIIVDDNGLNTDHQRENNELFTADSGIKYIVNARNSGAQYSRNMGFLESQGEYVAFLDDDDRYLPEKLERQIRFMQKYDLDGSYHDVRWFDENERQVEYRSMNYTEDYSQEGLLKAHILHSIAPTAIYMFRRDQLLKTEGFGEVPSGQDFILMLRCIEKGLKMRYLEGAYVIQYLHGGKRISLGDNKVKGENMLYELKHNYFHLLTKQERTYVKFRHYAVLAFSSMRSGKLLRGIKYALMTAGSSPKYCIEESVRYFSSKFRRK